MNILKVTVYQEYNNKFKNFLRMFTLKADNLKVDLGQIHFKQWNVKANSVLSAGSVIFTYEYESEGKLKTEKYKSTLNGITVKEIFSFSPGHIINSE